ncbi:hypothetical protein ACFQ06_15755, partial [Tessaracoccus lubricantis]
GTERFGVVAVAAATRLPSVLAERGGWGEHQIILPEGRYRCALSGLEFDGGAQPLAQVLAELPVALLVAVTS